MFWDDQSRPNFNCKLLGSSSVQVYTLFKHYQFDSNYKAFYCTDLFYRFVHSGSSVRLPMLWPKQKLKPWMRHIIRNLTKPRGILLYPFIKLGLLQKQFFLEPSHRSFPDLMRIAIAQQKWYLPSCIFLRDKFWTRDSEIVEDKGNQSAAML